MHVLLDLESCFCRLGLWNNTAGKDPHPPHITHTPPPQTWVAAQDCVKEDGKHGKNGRLSPAVGLCTRARREGKDEDEGRGREEGVWRESGLEIGKRACAYVSIAD